MNTNSADGGKMRVALGLTLLLFFSLGCVVREAQVTPSQPETTIPPASPPTSPEGGADTAAPTTPAPETPAQTTASPTPAPQTATKLPDGKNYVLAKIADGLDDPLYLTHAGDGSGRLFVVEQKGVIKIIKNGAVLSTPFLDISQKVRSGGERGMLGLAFHPNYSRNGYFFVHYSDSNGDTVISRFRVSSDPDRADPNSEDIVLTEDQPYPNHNGGQIVFGPDGYLYIGLGDGGAGGDPHGNGQDLQTMLGKILRIKVDTLPYSIPPTNPFISKKAKPEIWAYGMRNPWRFSFDRATGDLYIADVGQFSWEEIDFQPAESVGGENYGWNRAEGKHCFLPGCDLKSYTAPVAEYDHSSGSCSVTGGYVYRGRFDNGLNGVYVYGDYCSGLIWALLKTSSETWENALLMDTGVRISSFGEDEAGEIYVVDHNGAVYWLRHTPVP